jgi:hypothetical protein
MNFKTINSAIVICALAVLLPVQATSDVFTKVVNGDNTFVHVSNEPWQPDEFENGTIIPATFVAISDITLDGKEGEPEWSRAVEVTVPLRHGGVEEAAVKALYTQDRVFIRVRWKDETENREHHPWEWDEAQQSYVSGPQVEDSVLLSFEAGCEWWPSFLDGYMYDFDGWHWMAARSDPLGQAIDMMGTVQDQDFPLLNFTRYESRTIEDTWNIKFAPGELHANWNEIDRTYLLQPHNEVVYVRMNPDGLRSQPEFVEQLPPPTQPPSDGTTRYPQYSPLKLEGQAGEVSAKGHWEDGYWTVEFSRIRVTPAETLNDVVLDRISQFSVHVYDQAERIGEASESGRLFLRFLPREELLVAE